MKLKITEIIKLFNGLMGLDGLKKGLTQNGGEGEAVTVFVPFKFTGKFTLLKVQLINALRKPIEDYNKAVADLQEQYKAQPGEAPDSLLKKAVALRAGIKDIESFEHEVAGMRTFKFSDLNIYDPETNPKGNVIASSIIEQVFPLIEEDKPAEAAE